MSEKENGALKVSDDVIMVTAAVAVTRVEGVASLIGAKGKNLHKMNFSKGVKVSREDDFLTIDIFINVYYGYRIPEVAWEVQESVKRDVMDIAGENARTVNIHVQSVEFRDGAAMTDEGEEVL